MYQITRDYIKFGNSRSGQRINKVLFIVSHDTGNPGSTSYDNRNYFNNQQPTASAHTFIDDKYILEIIPLNEKAWHVQYNKPRDNQLFGDDANDAAIGVELCWGPGINFEEAYNRYVWYHAYLCRTFNLNPRKHIVAHKTLDPQRRNDPENALNRYGITWSQFIEDVSKAFEERPKEERYVSTSPILKKGDKGDLVRVLHYFLAVSGHTRWENRYNDTFTETTESAVKRFQKEQRIGYENGIVDYNTFVAFAMVMALYREHWVNTHT